VSNSNVIVRDIKNNSINSENMKKKSLIIPSIPKHNAFKNLKNVKFGSVIDEDIEHNSIQNKLRN